MHLRLSKGITRAGTRCVNDASMVHMNAVAPMFKDAASKVTAELKKIDQKLSDAFSNWLKDEVNDYRNRLQTGGQFLAENYEFQESSRTQVPNPNSFDINQLMAAITGSGFPTLNAAALLP
ncbi:hypothetical protein C8R43DRAFT_943455 [Mycena crocata]|nr:hypothetical protein C8R43DRAFT_943455 [Mycena crocata]